MNRSNIHPVFIGLSAAFLILLAVQSCTSSSGKTSEIPASQEVPVMRIDTATTTTYRNYSASLEGMVVIDIRAQVEGMIEAIYVDEGAFVTQGQPLFRINDLPYREQLNNALGAQHAAEAALYAAELEVTKLTALTKGNVVSDVQLKIAESSYRSAKSQLEQTKAAVGIAEINLGYTLIKAPVSGYIGRIPRKIGSLVSRADPTPLTVLSDVSRVYAYFSMSEMDFIAFNRENEGKTVQDKIAGLPPVMLVLADEQLYGHAGKIEMVEGQFDRTTGSISLRAAFPNPDGFLRSGSTGKVQMARLHPEAILVPQKATVEIQDKLFVYVIGDSNKVRKQPVHVEGLSGNGYIIRDGLQRGERIVVRGIEKMKEGMQIMPKEIPADSITE